MFAGACLGALLSQGGSSRRHIPWFKRFWNDRDRADFVACGTAAGARLVAASSCTTAQTLTRRGSYTRLPAHGPAA